MVEVFDKDVAGVRAVQVEGEAEGVQDSQVSEEEGFAEVEYIIDAMRTILYRFLI